MTKKIILEQNVPFSKSMMWQDQKRYYDQKGIAAWNEDVPFYITSNPFIGKSYAQMTISFVQDWLRKNSSAISHPFYIIEIGAGTGQFSFYFLKNLLQLKTLLKLDELKIHYIMSDISEKSFEFWGNHAGLKPFIDAGVLDFAAFDMYQSNEIKLHYSKKIISNKNAHNPLIIVANYLFDSIATDVFTVRDGKLYESSVTLKTDANNVEKGQPRDWKKVDITYTEKHIENTYYGNEFDAILFDYAHQLVDTSFQFPIASLIALKQFQVISNNQFLLLSSDKGYTNLEEMDHCDYPELDFHGSFSVMVNYHAIGAFLKKSRGDAQMQAFREHIATGIFSSGFSFDDFYQLQLSLQQVIHGFSPTDYFIIYEHFIDHYKTCSLEVMASYLNLSHWDPYVFESIAERLCSLAEKGDPDVVAFLSEHMAAIADNFYALPNSEDVFFNIGVFFQNIGRFEDAVSYYEKSQLHFGENDVVLFNMGMCYYSLDYNQKAIACLEAAQKLNANASDAKEWIKTIRQE